MEAAVHLLWPKDVVAIWPTGFDHEEVLIYQPYATATEISFPESLLYQPYARLKEMNGANVEKLQLEEMIPYIVLSTKDDVLLLIGVAECNLVLGRQRRTFWMQNSKTFFLLKNSKGLT